MSDRLRWRAALRSALHIVGATGLVVAVGFSAIITKDAQTRSALPPLAEVDQVGSPAAPTAIDRLSTGVNASGVTVAAAVEEMPSLVVSDPLDKADKAEDLGAVEDAVGVPVDETYYPPETRWFNGRPVKPAKTITMVVTAYTPDEISCGESADGITSSNHSVWTNGMRLVAADSRVLPLGSIITVPGYAGDAIVPVLDRGGKIKGKRLDVLFADNATARSWGKKTLTVTVWEYADGRPAEDWRAIRDSRK